ncbi:MAG: tetratricopeptide repeat protein [Acidimicrobiales bacterium]
MTRVEETREGQSFVVTSCRLTSSSVTSLSRVGRLDPRSWDYLPPSWVTRLASRLFVAGTRNVKPDQTIAMAQEEMARYERRYGRDNQLTINSMCTLASLMRQAKRLDEATALYEEALGFLMLRRGSEHRQTMYAEAGLGLTFVDCGRYEEAVPLLTHAIQVPYRPDGARIDATASQMISLGQALMKLGRYEEAQDAFKRSIAEYRRLGLQEHRNSLAATWWLATCLEAKGDIKGAIAIQRAVAEQFGRLHGTGDPNAVKARMQLAMWLHRVQEDAEAKVLLLGIIEVKTRNEAGEDDSRDAKELLADIERSE